MTIRLLPATTVNRIAAGEVVERPLPQLKSWWKTVLMRMPDAWTSSSEMAADRFYRWWMTALESLREELPLAMERHATSKLLNDNLETIATLGFRGEALPSIASVSRLTVTSRQKQAADAWTLRVEGGTKFETEPAAHVTGTTVEVRDLFYATPARLKFLKTARTELNHVLDTVRRLAMAHPEIAFSLRDGERHVLKLSHTQGT